MEEFIANPVEDLIVDLENLRQKVNEELEISLATESLGFSDVINNVIGFFSNGIQAFSEFFKTTERNIFRNEPLPHFTKCEDAMKKVGSLVSGGGELYSKVKDLKVPYLQGCTMQLDELTNRLVALSPNHREIVLKCLDDLDTTISKIITDKDYLSGFRSNGLSESMENAKKYIDSIKELNSDLYTKLTDKNDIRKIEEVIPNISSLEVISNNLLELKKTLDNAFLPKCNDIATALHNKLKAVTGESKISKNNLKSVSDQILIAAESLTYTATLYYLVTQSVLSFNALVKTISEKR